jgi:putative aldouronate transport system permease protein
MLYLILLPVVTYYLIFCYLPMYGIVISFMEYRPRLGFFGSKWVGLEHFKVFFSGMFFPRLMKNTFLLSFYGLVFGFPIPVIFAILLNELRSLRFKKFVQTITYLPHFITVVVISSLVLTFTNAEGFITMLFNIFTGHSGSLIGDSGMFRGIYVISGIWEGFGWGSIVFLAAISGINSELYEAATIDGANRLRRIWHVTVPGIMPTIVILLILSLGSIMSVGWEKAFLLQSPLTYETSDIISTYVYRKGFEENSFSFSSAVGLFNALINMVFLIAANTISRRVSDNVLW